MLYTKSTSCGFFGINVNENWNVLDGATLSDDKTLECDVAIFGTGAGGGTAAEILSSKECCNEFFHTKKGLVFTRPLTLGGRWDLNPRPPEPQSESNESKKFNMALNG